ncbi:pleiotropic drug resistance protein 2 isoform X2 [Neltuma alba]|uniref:pleiotropic drug resistance protein 2 isoform X2 n=1 Tax=Neltuma alba TaxID=207710 RepID=UPI0010A2D7EE|nr:pleiotropic drug resistance protein 2-like isoform X2 [Prosopis alba]
MMKSQKLPLLSLIEAFMEEEREGDNNGGIRANSSLRMSIGSMSSRRSWVTASMRDTWSGHGGVFERSMRREDEDEEELKWAAIERLPTFERIRTGMMKKEKKKELRVLEDFGTVDYEQVDVTKLGIQEKRHLLDCILQNIEEDNLKFLQRLRNRIDKVGIEIPKIEVRFEHLFVEGEAYIGTRALPTLVNSTLNAMENVLGSIKLFPSKKRVVNILQDVSGILKPSRMTLLLGPPGAGKTTLLQALANKSDKDLRVSGRITYCGRELSEFVPQRTCAYISQHDLHHGEMTVRETLDFSARCLGVGTRYELLLELLKREKQTRIKPDPEIDAFMKATATAGQETTLVTDYILKILGLETCADTLVGDEMRRGISGGERKRLTTGEMLVGPAKAFFMDEISTGLDSSTTFQIVRSLGQMVHIMDVTMLISLLQPAPETYDLFDDIILLAEGQIVYQGPRENILSFFESVGFKCPERKGIADFLQEVTSKKDQEQYWFRRDKPYQYVSVPDLVDHFNKHYIGQKLYGELQIPYDQQKTHPAALVTEKYGVSRWELFKACFARECLLLKRNSFIYIFKTTQIIIMSLIALTVFLRTEMKYGKLEDGTKFFGALFFSLINVMFNGMAELALTILRLPVFFKQRDFLFYPAWAFALPIWVLRIPLSLMESGLWVVLTYYTIGFAPSASRFFRQFLAFFCVHQMGLSLFRFIAALGRTQIVANTLGTFTLLLVFVLGGFIVAKDDIKPWMIWGYYASPMMYGQNAIVINEFLDKRWSAPNIDPRIPEPTVGKALLKARGMFTEEYWYWISVGALLGFSLLFNICFIAALAFLSPFGDSKSITVEEDVKRTSMTGSSSIEIQEMKTTGDSSASTKNLFEGINIQDGSNPKTAESATTKRGMVLPFRPLSLAFDHVNYYVDMPTEMKKQGIEENRLQILRNVSGAFRPGVLTALVGVSGAGKTTLMDVLAGRKTGGYIEGSISISGFPKNQATFARISGYCEQNDIHSPHVTVYESLIFSAWLRLGKEVNRETQKMFVEEVMELVELRAVKDFLVGLPGIDGLSTEQRKRLTIAVELVANPSIIFMDEPTSGLDARAAAIVMRTIRNTVDTGRTVVCTIHQPSIDIFEAFDELLLMKRGGQVIYSGPLGRNSQDLIEYFEVIPSVPKIKDGINPATWMLEITSTAAESQLGVDFAELYSKSELYQRNQKLIKDQSTPAPGSKDLYFSTTYSQPFITQTKACFWKQHLSYWRNPPYNAIRLFLTVIVGVMFGLIFWKEGDKIQKEQELFNLIGAIYSAIFFLGAYNTSSVQPVVAIERTAFYRERAAGMYSAIPYAFAQVAVEMIYVAIQTLLYSLILFSMMGFSWQVDKFMFFYYFLFMCFVYYTLYGMMTVALTPNPQVAAIIMSFFLSLWNLFTGFIIPRRLIPIWWRWYYWLSPTAWTTYGIVTSQIGDKNNFVEVPGSTPISLKDYLKKQMGYEYGFLGVAAAAHIAFAVLFVFVFAYGIKFLNFQTR